MVVTVLVPGLADAGASVGGLRLSRDSLVGYFHASGRPDGRGGNDLYVTTRSSPTVEFGAVTSLGSALNSAADELDPAPSADGTALIFARTPIGGYPQSQLLEATRGSGQPFTGPSPLRAGFVAAPYDQNPYWAPDGTHYFASQRTDNYDLYTATSQVDGFVAPVPLPGVVNTAGFDEVAPVVTADGLTLYYASNRTDGGSSGGLDVWTATRATVADDFPLPSNVQAVNSSSSDLPTFATSDGCTLYLSSARDGAPRMYLATRSSR